MPQELPYTSSIRDMPLMFSEIKRAAILSCEGRSGDEINQLKKQNEVLAW